MAQGTKQGRSVPAHNSYWAAALGTEMMEEGGPHFASCEGGKAAWGKAGMAQWLRAHLISMLLQENSTGC